MRQRWSHMCSLFTSINMTKGWNVNCSMLSRVTSAEEWYVARATTVTALFSTSIWFQQIFWLPRVLSNTWRQGKTQTWRFRPMKKFTLPWRSKTWRIVWLEVFCISWSRKSGAHIRVLRCTECRRILWSTSCRRNGGQIGRLVAMTRLSTIEIKSWKNLEIWPFYPPNWTRAWAMTLGAIKSEATTSTTDCWNWAEVLSLFQIFWSCRNGTKRP